MDSAEKKPNLIPQLMVLPKILTKKHVVINDKAPKPVKGNLRPICSNIRNSSEIADFLLKSNIINQAKQQSRVRKMKPASFYRFRLEDSIDFSPHLNGNSILKSREPSKVSSNNDLSFRKTHLIEQGKKDSKNQVDLSPEKDQQFFKRPRKKESSLIYIRKQFVKDFSFEDCEPKSIHFNYIVSMKERANLSKSNASAIL